MHSRVRWLVRKFTDKYFSFVTYFLLSHDLKWYRKLKKEMINLFRELSDQDARLAKHFIAG